MNRDEFGEGRDGAERDGRREVIIESWRGPKREVIIERREGRGAGTKLLFCKNSKKSRVTQLRSCGDTEFWSFWIACLHRYRVTRFTFRGVMQFPPSVMRFPVEKLQDHTLPASGGS